MTKVAYKKGTRAKAAVAVLLDNTGKGEGRNGRSSDYNFCRDVAQFGNENGFITGGQMRILGCMYNRVMKSIGSRSTSWKRLGS